jgi:hypothetical protein
MYAMHRSVFCLFLGHLSTDLRAVFTNRYSNLHTIRYNKTIDVRRVRDVVYSRAETSKYVKSEM